MRNRDVEENIRSAFSKVTGDDQLTAILSDCREKEVRIIMSQENNNRWMPRLAAMALACCLLIGMFAGFSKLSSINEAVAATICLDVNPGIEIEINKKERVLDVRAMNEDANKIIGDMDFKGSDLKVTVNALIGSLVRNGYINELANSILVSVNDPDEAKADELELKLMEEISTLLENSSVLAQKIMADDKVSEIARTYGITLGKAQLIKELSDRSTIYTYEDLAGLSINELNLLNKNIEDSSLQRNGQPSDKAYIGTEKAKETAFSDLGVKEADVYLEKVELDYEQRTMVYEIEFTHNGVEYEYVIDASSGKIIHVDVENDRNGAAANAPQPAGNASANGGATASSASVSEEKAKQTALANAGVNAADVTGFRIEKEYDDGVLKYEIDFYVGGVEYDYDIDANTGAIIKAEKEIDDDYRPQGNSSAAYAPAGTTHKSGDDVYKVEDGKVYEYDDGKWEYEEDKKVENGQVYEYDDGRWEKDDDDDDDDYRPASTSSSADQSSSGKNQGKPASPAGTTHQKGDDAYKVEDGKVYEYDDGKWEYEEDKKVENGQVYEYDDGKWEVDDDDDDFDDDDD